MNNEEVRLYWDRRPCNVRHSFAPRGTREYFDEVENRKYLHEPHIPRFADFSWWVGQHVLEVGCGIGTDAINFMRAGALYQGVDISPMSVRLAAQRADVYGLRPHRPFRVVDAERLDLPCRPYGLIYSFGVLHHTSNPRAVIKRLAKCYSGPGTELRLMLYARVSLRTLELWLQRPGRSIDDAVRMGSEAQPACPITRTYTVRSAKRLLAPWFDIIDVRKDHIFRFEYAPYVADRTYRRRRLYRMLGPWAFAQLERAFGWHLLIKARRNHELV